MTMTSEALRHRGRTVTDHFRMGALDGRQGEPHQVVIKVCGRTKSAHGASAMAAYLSRTRAEDRGIDPETGVSPFGSINVFDEGGNPVTPDEVKGEIRSWGLMTESENLSPLAISLGADAGELPEKERLYHDQVVHLVWSIKDDPEVPRDQLIARLESATLGVLDEMVASRNVRAVWGIHHAETSHKDRDGQGHPHVHMLVAVRSGPGDPLKVDRDFLDSMRVAAARNGRGVGLNVVAERREDRAEVRDDVLAGRQRLRQNRKMVRIRRNTRLAARVPDWYMAFGIDYEKRRLKMRRLKEEARRAAAGEARAMGRDKETNPEVWRTMQDMLPSSPKKLRRRRAVPEFLKGLYETVGASFENPEAAMDSYRRMATEGARSETGKTVLPNKKYADWFMRKQPLVFGPVTSKAAGHVNSAAVIIALKRCAPEPAPALHPTFSMKAWRKTAAAVIELSATAAFEEDRRRIVAGLRDLGAQIRDHAPGLEAERADRIFQIADAALRRPAPKPEDLAARQTAIANEEISSRETPRPAGKGVER